MKRLLYIVLICNIFAKHIVTFAQPKWNRSLSFENIEYQLKNEKIKSIKLIKSGIGKGPNFGIKREVYLITLKNGLKTIFKPRKFLENCAEVAAYKTSNFFKLYLVPPTILRTINNREGSLQLFVETKLSKQQQSKAFFDLDQNKIANIYIFQFILGNYGWGPTCQYDTNMIIPNYNKKSIVLFDFETISHIQKIQYGDYPYIKWDNNNNWLDVLYQLDQFPFDKSIQLNSRNLKEKIETLKIFNCTETIKYFAKTNTTYCIYANSLWFKNINSKTKNYTTIYPQQTLKIIKKLDYDSLRAIWSHALLHKNYKSKISYEAYFDLLFNLILERRDAIIIASKKMKV